MLKPKYKLSIALTTYNHERFIADSLDSILSQDVNFEYEIVIGEDKSTDKTVEIIKSYQAKYPKIIRLIERPNNLGYTKNFDDTMQQCQGEYVAIFDGDDLMRPGKLQKQIHFLDNNPDFAIVGHIAREFESSSNETLSLIQPKERKDFYTIEDLILYGSFFANSTKVFRKRSYPPNGINNKIKFIADLAVTMDIVNTDKIGFIWETLVDYRVHKSSIMRKLKGRDDFEDRMLIIKSLSEKYDKKYDHLFYNQLAYSYLVYGIEEFNEGNRKSARDKFISSIKHNYRYSLTPYYYLISSFLPMKFHDFAMKLAKR